MQTTGVDNADDIGARFGVVIGVGGRFGENDDHAIGGLTGVRQTLELKL